MATAIFSGGRRFRGRSQSSGEINRVPLKGLFADGVWQCNCHPRLPAEHFQTKNGGKNHGRWCKNRTFSKPVLEADWIGSLHMPETTAEALQLLPLGRSSEAS